MHFTILISIVTLIYNYYVKSDMINVDDESWRYYDLPRNKVQAESELKLLHPNPWNHISMLKNISNGIA